MDGADHRKKGLSGDYSTGSSARLPSPPTPLPSSPGRGRGEFGSRNGAANRVQEKIVFRPVPSPLALARMREGQGEGNFRNHPDHPPSANPSSHDAVSDSTGVAALALRPEGTVDL